MKYTEDHIIVDEHICNGKPIIKGTRITVQTILEYLAAGDSVVEILQQYPALKRDDIYASLKFAADLMGNQTTTKKTFDAVKYMREQRNRLSEKLSQMTKAEIVEYFRQKSEGNSVRPGAS
jgi:uncharacterized protein (DUF433 family)